MVLSRVPVETSKTRDITGGLPRIEELFRARKPKECAIISEIDGRVSFGKDYKNKRRIIVTPDQENEESVEYMIPKGKYVTVQEGDLIRRGDFYGWSPGASRYSSSFGCSSWLIT